MSEVRVNNLSNENNTGGPTISGITTFSGSNFLVPPQGDTESRPSSCPPGSLRFNTDSAKLEYYRGNTIGWVEIEAELTEPLGGGSGSNTGLGTRGLILAGDPSTVTIEFFTVSTLGNAADFGDLTNPRKRSQQVPSPTRAVIIGGGVAPSEGNVTSIEKVEILTTGASVDFGTLANGVQAGGYFSNGHGGL